MDSFTGNPMRDAALMRAVTEIINDGHKPTVERVTAQLPEARFPGLGEILQEEVEAASAIYDAAAEAHSQHLTELAADSAPVATDGAAAPSEPAAPSPITRDAAVERLRLANVSLADARVAVVTLQNKRVAARDRLSAAIGQWQIGVPKPYPNREALVRAEIAAAQEYKQRLKDGRAAAKPQRQPGPSYLDRAAAYGRDESADGFTRKMMRRGGRRFTAGDFMGDDGRIHARPPRLPSDR